MKNFYKSLKQDADNLVKQAEELKEMFNPINNRHFVDKEAMVNTEEAEENIEAELEREYSGSQQEAQDIYDRTEMDAINNN